jgi:hypothetical protein
MKTKLVLFALAIMLTAAMVGCGQKEAEYDKPVEAAGGQDQVSGQVGTSQAGPDGAMTPMETGKKRGR